MNAPSRISTPSSSRWCGSSRFSHSKLFMELRPRPAYCNDGEDGALDVPHNSEGGRQPSTNHVHPTRVRLDRRHPPNAVVTVQQLS
jgi:hypothetical protein